MSGTGAVKHTQSDEQGRQTECVSESRERWWAACGSMASVKAGNAHSPGMHLLDSVARQWEPLKVHEQGSELDPAAAVPLHFGWSVPETGAAAPSH